VLLSSTKDKDTVINPVKIYTLECGHKSCLFRTGDHNPEDTWRMTTGG
jgi:hypothetical protein